MPPAARLADPTTHGSPLAPGVGSTNVLICSQPAWRVLIDQHACPAVSVTGADGVGSVLMGSPTVFINNQMACRMGDIVMEKPGLALGPVNPVIMGCPTVMIGGPTAGVSVAGGAMTVVQGGVNITGATPDVIAFLQMTAAIGTQAGRAAMAHVIGDTAHPITLKVGRGQSNTIIDNFALNTVDVGDLEQVPASASAAHPNTTSRDEMIVHFMVERNDAATTGNPDFDPAHQRGIDAQNQMRAERGQSAVTSQDLADGTDADGNRVGRTNYADGTHQDAHIDGNNNIVRVDPP